MLSKVRQGSNQPIKMDAIVDSLTLEKTTKVSVDFFLAKFYSHFASKTNTVWHEIFVVLIFAIFPAIAKISSREKKIKIKKILQTFFFKNLLQSKYSLSNLNSLHIKYKETVSVQLQLVCFVQLSVLLESFT